MSAERPLRSSTSAVCFSRHLIAAAGYDDRVRERLLAVATRWLGGAQTRWTLAAVASVFALPALFVGLQLDDYYQLAVLRGTFERLGLPSPGGMFTFLDGVPEHAERYREVGVLPWWAPTDIHLAFWRPLSELTHRLDHTAWPGAPWLMHVHSLVWWAALVVVAATAYRRLAGGGWVAGLAGLLFAVDDAHGLPIGWIANRNALMAATFGLLALLAHDRWRRDGWRPGAPLSLVALGLGLLSGEAALGAVAYLGAYALCLDRGRLAVRLATLLPAGALVVAWRLAYNALGYGAHGSRQYVDPGTHPLQFLGVLAYRAPVLLASQLGPVPADVDMFLAPAAQAVFVTGAVLFLGALAVATWRLMRDDAAARFFAVGAVLAVVPVSGTFPNDRLLVYAGFGAFGLVAKFLASVLDAADPGRLRKAAAGFLAVTHLGLAPLLLPARVYQPAVLRQMLSCVDAAPTEPVFAQQTLVIVASHEFCAVYLPLQRALDGRVAPARLRLLSTAMAPMTLRRADAQTLVLRRDDGFLNHAMERLFLAPDKRWVVGDKLELPGFSAEVLSLTADGLAHEVAYRFDVPLEDASLRWFTQKDGKFVRFEVPAPGQEVALDPGPPF